VIRWFNLDLKAKLTGRLATTERSKKLGRLYFVSARENANSDVKNDK